MTIKARQKLVSTAKHYLKCPYGMKAEYITIHNTAMDAPAGNEINYMISNNTATSYHFAIDDKEVVQGLPLNKNGFHAGDGKIGSGNRKSIGIEICYSKGGGSRYKKAEALTVRFVAQLLRERNWGVERVVSHKHWTQVGVKKGYSSYVKNCPHRILNEGRWNSFLAAVHKELTGKTTVVPVSNPSTSTSPLLKNGSTGSVVREMQSLLVKKGYKVDVDGIFGVATLTIVKKFQEDNKLEADGYVGAKTWEKLRYTAPKAPTPAKPTPVKKPVLAKPKFRVIAGSFADRKNADKHVADLKKKGIDSFIEIIK